MQEKHYLEEVILICSEELDASSDVEEAWESPKLDTSTLAAEVL